jgi:hypothetical protein
MYSKYIVLKKTGAALHLWSQPDEADNTLKGERAELTETFTPIYPDLDLTLSESEIHYPHIMLRQHFLKFLFFLTPKQKEKRKFLLTVNSKPHEEQYKFF